MPQWEITDNHTGDTFTIESDEAPTQDYLSDYIKKQDDQSDLEKSNAAFRGVKLSPYEQQVLGMGGRVSEPPAVDVPELLQQLKATSAGAGGLLEKGAEEALILPQRLKEMVSPTPGTELQSVEERLGPSRQAAKEVLGSPLGVPALAPPPEDVDGEGVGPTLRRFGYEMSKPVSAGLLLATPESELLKAGFGAQMAGDTAEAVKNLAGAQTPDEIKGRLADVVLKGGMAAMLGKGHPEKIVSAAVKDAEGNVHTGANHPEIVKDLGLKGFDERESRNTPDFGYVTESGKFITRPQAALLAKKTGQQLEPFDVDSKGVEQPHSDEIASPVEPDKALGDVPQPVVENPDAKPYFDPQSEALGLGRPSTAPTVEDVRAQRAADAAKPSETPTEGGSQKYGIAQRVRDERAAAGVVDPVEPGKGVSAPDSVEHGRELLAKDPQAGVKALAAFEADPKKAISHDAMAATRAHGEYLQKAATDLENRYGTDSEQYQKARKELSDWDKRTKPMQTEWAKIGKAQQGETDIDTGSFTGLSRAYEQSTGEQFTPEQEKTAKDIAGKKKKADQSADVAAADLKDQLTKEATSPEQRALDAASKTVRENAIRLAEAENKARVADEKLKQATAKIQEDAKRNAEAANSQTVIEAARRLAAAERMAAAAPNDPAANARVKAAKAALDAAHKTVREAAVRAAAEENAGRVKDAAKAKKIADFQLKAAKGARDAAQKRVTDAAKKAAEKARKDQAMDPRDRVLAKVRDYIDNLGMDDIDDIRNKIATELGMSPKKVATLLGKTPRTKFMMDDVWKKKQVQRKLEQAAKRWLTDQAVPAYQRALKAVPSILFGIKVGFHGTVALGTHAPTVAFDPRFWKVYGQNFAKMYRMVGNKAYYEMQMQDLVRRKSYTIARRAGLQNDPFQYEELTAAGQTGEASTMGKISKPFADAYNAMTAMGNRGYSVLKLLRQDMFDQQWNNLPKTLQYPEMAKGISKGVNHSTGITETKPPSGTETVLFAPRLEASRIAMMITDPAIALKTGLDWKNATDAEKHFALEQVKSKAWIAGTYFGMLALNQGLLSATGSDQKINFTDPLHSDFLKFKVGGMNLAYGNPMLTLIRLPARLFKIRESDGGKLKNLVYPDENTYTVLGEYGRSQLSPFASLATTLWMKGDWQNRPLPNSERSVPKRLRAQGVEPYTWPEFWTEQALPIPFEEATREVWKTGMGMDDEQYKEMRKAFATWSVMTATGARLNEDMPYGKPVPTPLP